MIDRNSILVLTNAGKGYWKERNVAAPATFIRNTYRLNKPTFLQWTNSNQFILKANGRGLYVLEKLRQKKIKFQAFWLDKFNEKKIPVEIKRIAKEHTNGRLKNSDKQILAKIELASNYYGGE